MPVPVAAIVAGAAGGVTMEYLIQRGNPTRKELATGAAVGAIPGVGLGVRGGIKLGTKLGKIGQLVASSRRLKDLRTIGAGAIHPGTPVFLGGHVMGFVTGAAAQAVLGMAYDRIYSRGGSSSPTSRKRDGPSLSRRTSRSPSFGKRRKRCKHRNKAGKQCLRPAGHSGRHRYS